MTAGRGGARVAAMSNSQSTSAGPPTGAAASRERQHRLYVVDGHAIESGKIDPGLHIVATPIGNLGDITLRALATLAGADLIACEDTRVTRKLLDRYGIATPLTPYHDHNAAIARPKLLQRLAGGAAIALVSDAGTPLVSDPGFKLVRAAQEAGHSVTALPGASAALAALAVAGLPTDQFFFAGFLPPKQVARRARIAELARIPATLVFFETGPRIAATLADLAAELGNREAAVCRELTKLHEEIRRGDLPALAQAGATGEIRGEIVLVVAPPSEPPERRRCRCAAARKRWRGFRSRMPWAKSRSRPAVSRRELYQRALALAKAEGAAKEVLAETWRAALNRSDRLTGRAASASPHSGLACRRKAAPP